MTVRMVLRSLFAALAAAAITGTAAAQQGSEGGDGSRPRGGPEPAPAPPAPQAPYGQSPQYQQPHYEQSQQPSQGQPPQGQPPQGQAHYQQPAGQQPPQQEPGQRQPQYQQRQYEQPQYQQGQPGHQEQAPPPRRSTTGTRGRPGLWIPGTVMLGVPLLINVFGYWFKWAITDDTGGAEVMIPVAGPLLLLRNFDDSDTRRVMTPPLVINSLIQTAGIALIIAGVSARREVVAERDRDDGPRWALLPSVSPRSVGLSLTVF